MKPNWKYLYLVRYKSTRKVIMKNIDLEILIKAHRVVIALDRKTSNLAAEYDLTFSQFMVLEALYSKGDMSISAVRKAILSSVGTISVIISNLEKNGYLGRFANPEDRRVCMLTLTQKGRDVIGELAPRNERMISEEMSHLSLEEKTQLTDLLSKLGDTL